MIQTVRCEICGKEFSWKNEECPIIHYSLVIETHLKPCEKCFHSDTREKEHNFCSENCLKEYVRKL